MGASDDRRQVVTAFRIVDGRFVFAVPVELSKPRGMEAYHE